MENKGLKGEVLAKMRAEQEEYKKWLIRQAPEAILAHAYEYALRVDIIDAVSNAELEDEVLAALLKSHAVLHDILSEYENFTGTPESHYADEIVGCIESYATAFGKGEWEHSQTPAGPCDFPVLYGSQDMAEGEGLLDEFNASQRLNEECREDFDKAISAHYDGKSLDTDAIFEEIVGKYGVSRTEYVLGCTVRQKKWDGRFSGETRSWAKAKIPVLGNDEDGIPLEQKSTLQSHAGLVEILAREARKGAGYMACHTGKALSRTCKGRGWFECDFCQYYVNCVE